MNTNFKIGILKHKNAILLSCFFFLVYSLLVFYNHYCFRTYALDLGVYTNAIYDYSHGQWNDASVFKELPRNLLSDHLDFTLILLSPFSYIFGQYTLLLLQIVFVIAGGFGVYFSLLLKETGRKIALVGMLNTYLFFGVFSALSFDYHSNVLAAMLFPWIFHALIQKAYWRLFLLSFLLLLTRESMALSLCSMVLGLILEFRKDAKAIKYLSILFCVSIIYFILAVKLIMPSLSPSGNYDHFKYSTLGSDYASAFKFVFYHPIETIRLLFVNHSGIELYNYVKLEFYFFIILSGFLLLFLRPAFILILSIPLFAKMAYDDPAIWSIDSHYSIEFTTVLSLGTMLVISQVKKTKIKNILLFLCSAGCFSATIRLMDNTLYFHDYNRLRLYQKGHYCRAHDVRKIYHAFDCIPADAIVSAQSPILPHLAYRDKIYQFPIVKDAEFIIVSKLEPITYPIDKETMLQTLQDTIASTRWKVLVNMDEVTVLQRK